jgi:Flp pilus assembly secretin CpaC
MTRRKYSRIPFVQLGAVRLPVYLTEDNEQHGWYDSWPEQAIHIAEHDEGSMARTVLHESIHAAADLYGIELSESKVRILEQAFAQIIVQNPKLVQALIRTSK